MSSSVLLTSKSMWVSSSSHPLSFTCQTPELCPNFRLRSKLPESARSISDCTHHDQHFKRGFCPTSKLTSDTCEASAAVSGGRQLHGCLLGLATGRLQQLTAR
jgi:hypothetical protein